MAKKKISQLPAGAPTTGAELVPIVQSGNTVRVTVDSFIPTQYRTLGSGDETVAIQAWLDTATPLGVKYLVGSASVNAALTVPAGVILDLSTATITQTTAGISTFILNADCTLRGGKIISPATWDGTNIQWTYAVVRVQGDNVTVDGLTLENVQKVGVGFQDVDNGIVTNCRITGNYPSAQWTGVETAHYGVSIDPASGTTGNFVIADNIIKTCVQGVFIGNYAAGGGGLGIAVTGNGFYGCWNHGVYGAVGSTGVTVTGNNFNRCQIPVALTGNYHVVSSNTMVTTNTGSQQDVAGISLRNPIGCVVMGNTIKGDAPPTAVIVDVRDLSGGTIVRDNVISHNVIEVTANTSNAIRVNTAAATCENNIIQGNRIRSAAVSGQGVITVNGTSGTYAKGTQVLDNEIVLIGVGHGVHALFQRDATIQGNKLRIEFDAASPVTIGGVSMNTVVSSRISHNSVLVEAAWGTNISIRGIWESTGIANSGNRIGPNEFTADLTKLTAALSHVISSTSGPVVEESGPGAPTISAGVGSRWWRTDGGAATTLYVKESGTATTGWVGK